MPRQIGKVSRDKRLQIIRQLLKHAGRLRKTELTRIVAEKLDVEECEVARALYSDLLFLETEGEVEVEYYTMGGQNIDPENIESQKAFRKEWIWCGTEEEIAGGGLLHGLNCTPYVSKRMRRACKIDIFTGAKNRKTANIVFNVGLTHLVFQIDKEQLPIVVVFGRESTAKYNPLSDAEKYFGKRTAVVLLPAPTVSACRSFEDLGHFAIKLTNEDTVQARDLGSRNGTKAGTFSEVAVDQIGHILGIQSSSRTVSHSRDGKNGNKTERKALDDIGNDWSNFKLPVLIEASKHFHVVVF